MTEQAGIVGKQAKQQPDQIAFQILAFVAGSLDGIVQASHFVGGFFVGGLFFLNGNSFVIRQKQEGLDVLRKVL
ncbi:MAG: hypothetical protein KGZ69_16850 [Methylomonas sp.]|nr:hypothetical protein [Methylomonas sp.]